MNRDYFNDAATPEPEAVEACQTCGSWPVEIHRTRTSYGRTYDILGTRPRGYCYDCDGRGVEDALTAYRRMLRWAQGEPLPPNGGSGSGPVILKKGDGTVEEIPGGASGWLKEDSEDSDDSDDDSCGQCQRHDTDADWCAERAVSCDESVAACWMFQRSTEAPAEEPAPVRCETCEDWRHRADYSFTSRPHLCGHCSFHDKPCFFDDRFCHQEGCHSTLRKPEREPVAEWERVGTSPKCGQVWRITVRALAWSSGDWSAILPGSAKRAGKATDLRSAQLAAEDALAELGKPRKTSEGWRNSIACKWWRRNVEGFELRAYDEGGWAIFATSSMVCVAKGPSNDMRAGRLAADCALAELEAQG